MTQLALIVFWGSVFFIVYTLAGYPVLLRVLGLFRHQTHLRGRILPQVSVIVVAHNSQAIIRQKLENTLQLRYPEGKWEVLVASDASTDDTHAIVESFAAQGVRLVASPERKGKHHAQKLALDASTGEIIVFTDSGIVLRPDALEQVVSNFADPIVGCVSSEDSITTHHEGTGESSYVPAEMRLRRLEARVGSLVGVSGSFFAARREVCSPWHSDQSSDFFVPLHAVAKGFRAVVDPDSVAQFGLVASKSEFIRKVRTIVHGLVVFFDHIHLLNPFRYGVFSWQLISHKLFRWLFPFVLITLLLSNLVLSGYGDSYRLYLFLQVLGYGIGLLSLSRAASGFKLARLASFFFLGASATLVAWVRFLTGEKYVTWEPSRR